MFCNGKCKKRNSQCGLLLSIIKSNSQTKEQKMEEKCALLSIAESLWSQEHGQIRIQAAVESGRNEQVRGAREQNKTIAQGFLGLIHTINENSEATKKMKYLGEVIEAEIEENEVELLEEE